MKAIFFSKPLELNLTIDGESWVQGANVEGTLIVSNHSNSTTNLSQIGCHLCYCSSRKFRAKDPKSVTVIESTMLGKDQSELIFNFKLQNDCPITENSGSLYILCGDISSPFEGGFLELKVSPMAPIVYFVDHFELFYRFKVKAFKNKKGFIEAAVHAPDSKEWASIQKMTLQMKMINDELEAKFQVTLKRLSFDCGPQKTKDEKKEITKTLTKKQYDLYGSANQDGIKKVIDELISEVKVKPI